MAVDMKLVEFDGGFLEYDPDMPMGVLRALFNAGQSGELDGMIEAFTGIVHSWSFAGDPSDIEAWDKLLRSEFMALNSALMGDLGDLGES